MEAFRAEGVEYQLAPLVKSDLYVNLVPAINAGQVALLDRPELLRELRGLERHRGASGRDRVDHRGGGSDDCANSVAGLVAVLAGQAEVSPEPPSGHIGSRVAIYGPYGIPGRREDEALLERVDWKAPQW